MALELDEVGCIKLMVAAIHQAYRDLNDSKPCDQWDYNTHPANKCASHIVDGIRAVVEDSNHIDVVELSLEFLAVAHKHTEGRYV